MFFKVNRTRNPFRRGAVDSENHIPVSAQSSAPLNPRGPATGFFTPPLYRNRAQPGNVAPPIGDVPLTAMTGVIPKRKKTIAALKAAMNRGVF